MARPDMFFLAIFSNSKAILYQILSDVVDFGASFRFSDVGMGANIQISV